MIRAGRQDLYKLVVRWGGMEQLAALTGLSLPSPQLRRGGREWRAHVAQVAAQTGLGGTEVRRLARSRSAAVFVCVTGLALGGAGAVSGFWTWDRISLNAVTIDCSDYCPIQVYAGQTRGSRSGLLWQVARMYSAEGP